METPKADPVPIHYRRGFLVYGALLAFGVPSILAILFLVFTAGPMLEEPEIYLALWAVVISCTLALSLVTLPLVERFCSTKPAIVVSSEGIWTRDMKTRLPWEGIEKLTTGPVTSWAGRHTTTINVFEISPSRPVKASSRWRKFIDGHANPLRIAWHLLADPERLFEALRLHAPPALLERSNLAGLPEGRNPTRSGQ